MTTVKCPRCQAEGKSVEVVLQDDWGVCPTCSTTWKRGKLGQLVAIG